MNPIRFSKLDVWNEFEQKIHSAIRLSLHALREIDNKSNLEEPSLNRVMYQGLRKAFFESNYPFSILFDAPNQPDPEDEKPDTWERKRPDLQIVWVDDQAENSRDHQKTYVIECKRLGEPLSKRSLTEAYVHQGIVRFVAKEYSYGRLAGSAAMIGYIQNREPDDIWKEVNDILFECGLPALSRPLRSENSVNEMNHTLDRSWISGRQLILRHFWMDLR